MSIHAMLRRAFSLVLTSALLAGASSVHAHGNGVYSARFHGAARPGTFDAPYGSTRTYVELRRALRPIAQRLYSTSNGNERYVYEATLEGEHSSVVLFIDGRAIVASGTSSTRSRTTAYVTVDRPTADAVVSSLRVARLDRVAVGERLAGCFSVARAVVRAGEPVAVTLEISNPADAPAVQRQAGGRQRGVRDNQFHFRVLRDGVSLEERPGLDFGGPTGFATIAPGDRATLTADVALWADLSAAGRYRVECAYETTLAPAGAEPFSEADRHRVWDRRFEGAVEFERR
jgi:hypothetical protein